MNKNTQLLQQLGIFTDVIQNIQRWMFMPSLSQYNMRVDFL